MVCARVVCSHARAYTHRVRRVLERLVRVRSERKRYVTMLIWQRKREREGEGEREDPVQKAKAKRSFLLCMAISHGSSSRALGFSLRLSRRSDRRSSRHGVAYAWRTCHQNEEKTEKKETKNNAQRVLEARSCRYECINASKPPGLMEPYTVHSNEKLIRFDIERERIWTS